MSKAITLYELEDTLVAMLNSIDMVEDPEQRAEAEQEIITLHLAAVEKRDRVAQFLSHCDNQEAFIKAEIDRLSDLKATFAKARERVEAMIVNTIQAIGQDDNGKWRKLDGRTCSFSLAKKPLSTEITSMEALPARFKDVSVKLPAEDWIAFVDELDIDQRTAFLGKLKGYDETARKSDVKKALELEAAIAAKAEAAGVTAQSGAVPGATFGPLSYRLVRK